MKRGCAVLERRKRSCRIFVAISMVVLMSFTALAVDYGMVYYHRSELQTALDSAALAAAQKLPDRSRKTNRN